MAKLRNRGGGSFPPQMSTEETKGLSQRPKPAIFAVPPQHYISVPFECLRMHLSALLDGDEKEKFGQFCNLIEAVYHFEFHVISRRLKDNFAFFSSRDPTVWDFKAPPGDTARIEALEDEFMGDFLTMMRTANFRLLSEEEWNMARQEDFTLNLPVKCEWHKLDDTLLTRTLLRNNCLDGAASFSKRLLIFRRGVGLAKLKSRFISEKIDLLLDYTIYQPLQRQGSKIWEWFSHTTLGARVAALFSRKKRNSTAQHSASVAASSHASIDHLSPRAGPSSFEQIASPEDAINAGLDYVERKTLSRRLFSSRLILQNFFTKIEIQEPTFKELVIVYRKKQQTPEDNVVHGDEPARNIFIKSFSDIPLADIPVSFPERVISVKLVTMLKLIMMVVLAVVAISTKINSIAHGEPAGKVYFLVSGFFAFRIFQMWQEIQSSKDKIRDAMTRTLYTRSNDNQSGVLSSLTDAMESQELKETILGYFATLNPDYLRDDDIGTNVEEGLSEREIDGLVEQWLKRTFRCNVDFEVDDALAKMTRDGLVHMVPGGQHDTGVARDPRYRAVSLDSVLVKLDKKWDNYFEYNR